VRAELRSLGPVTAERVARHLVATAQLLDEDPESALEQARAARAFGARLGVVREAVGVAAYRAGEWAEAIGELRTARRLTGDHSHLPLIADSERALGRPERALAVVRSPEAGALPPALRAELRIVEAGARRDLGQIDAAVVALQGADLDRRAVRPWSARLWYAYADLLVAREDVDGAREWFLAAASVDEDGETDAAERLLELDGVTVLDEDEDYPDEDLTGGGPDAVDSEMDAVDSEMDAVDGEIDVVEGGPDAVDGEMDAVDGEIDVVDGEMDAVDGEIDVVEGGPDAVEGEPDLIEGEPDSVDGRTGAVDGPEELDAAGDGGDGVAEGASARAGGAAGGQDDGEPYEVGGRPPVVGGDGGDAGQAASPAASDPQGDGPAFGDGDGGAAAGPEQAGEEPGGQPAPPAGGDARPGGTSLTFSDAEPG
jgi:hypothetical protein